MSFIEKSCMKPKLIIFDLFGTLIFPVEKIKREEFFAFYQKLGIELKTEEEIKSFTLIFTQLMSSAESWHDLSKKLLENTIKNTDQKIVNELADFFKENSVYQVFDDVKEIINLPHKKAILTTGSRFMFSNLGLEKYFSIFTPRETKFLKPDQRAFLAVLEKFGFLPKETIMIGDEIEKDIAPAKKLGMEAILIDRKNKIENPCFRKIISLKELKEILI